MDRKKLLVLFDMGGVLLKLDYTSFYEKCAEISNTSPKDFEKAFLESRVEEKALLGEISTDEYYQGLDNLLSKSNRRFSRFEFKDLVKNFFKGQADDVVALKEEINKAGYSVGLSSNADVPGLEIIEENWPQILETFGGPKIYSFERHAVKPDSRMYGGLENYDNVIFIDDKPAYLKTGIQDFGWKGIFFTPFIDSAEAIRSIPGHNDGLDLRENYAIANSTQELRKSLGDFGIPL